MSARRCRTPSAAHWLGTDHLGRDMVSLVMKGTLTSFVVAAIAVAIGAVIGVPLGLAAAAWGGPARVGDPRASTISSFAFPALIIAILITDDLRSERDQRMIAVGIFNIPVFARVARGRRAQPQDPRLCRGGAPRRPRAARDRVAAHPAQHREPPHRAGDDPAGAGHPRRSQPQLCRARHAAARHQPRADAQGCADLRAAEALAGADPGHHASSSSSSRSTSRATACATCSIPSSAASEAPVALLEVDELTVSFGGTHGARCRELRDRQGRALRHHRRERLGQDHDWRWRSWACCPRSAEVTGGIDLRRRAAARRRRRRGQSCAASASAWCSRSR